ncbi:glycosyltransferase family 2 protein [Kocuria tytonis]|uniref:Glycosyltransferase n=1 Tax=Kocuria tytonis TaxID=2054280 RepID=A0A495ABH6_9MICC|nr:glycosyltransferase [Kocuria tytonis]RKQ36870.1 glycosyltransferase [Kocuria tytonis]
MSGPGVSVVVPYFENQRGLDRLLAALARQDHPARDLEVVVGDDGSARPPVIPDTPFTCSVVRQENLGFRAGAARNLGARAASGAVLVFLDGDMIPEPGFLTALLRGVRAADDGHGVLAVGARHHADLAACGIPEVLRWVAGEHVPGVRRLADPAWLADGYARTADLRAAGAEDFRLVISALLAVDRELFERCGGFDESLVGYGGEDWDLAYRCWQLGARFTHVPGAGAWHDGPDLAGRPDTRAVKDAETLALAQRIPRPSTRGAGVRHEQPWAVVRVSGHHDDAEAYLGACHLLRDTDAGVWFVDRDDVPRALAADPRISAGRPPAAVVDRAVVLVDVHAPLTLEVPLRQWCARGESEVPGLLTVRSVRAVHRAESRPVRVPRKDAEPTVRPARTDRRLEDRMGRHG